MEIETATEISEGALGQLLEHVALLADGWRAERALRLKLEAELKRLRGLAGRAGHGEPSVPGGDPPF